MKKEHRGDDGYTDVARGRVPKDSPLIEFVGSIDELISFLGIVRSILAKNNGLSFISLNIKNMQIVLMLIARAVVGYFNTHTQDFHKYVSDIEKEIATINEKISLGFCFTIPGGSYESSLLHFARTLCRHAERRAATLLRNGMIDRYAYIYLNRLSDLLYLYAIYVDVIRGIDIECLA